MASYYCHSCAAKNGWLGTPPTGGPTGNVYQADKFIKHTMPTRSYGINSTFDDTSVKSVSDLQVNALASGSLEIDDHGRHNVLWVVGRDIGTLHVSGSVAAKQDVMKVVLPYDAAKVHSFSTSSAALISHICTGCGKAVFT